MNWLGAALIASAGVPLARAIWANRHTALIHALAWATAAWVVWIVTTIVQSSAVCYVALSLTACSGVAVFGARRPGVTAWHAVVAGLLTVLLVPLASRLLSGGPPPNNTLYALFLAVVLVIVIANYLPTRLCLGAASLALGCAVALVSDDFKFVWQQDWIAQGLIAAAPWLAWCVIAARPLGSSEGDQVWGHFRDSFGFVWEQRLCEQFNRAAANAKLAVELRWTGLRRLDGAPLTEANQAASLELLRALMQRFV